MKWRKRAAPYLGGLTAVLLSLFAAAGATAATGPSTSVINGNEAAAGTFPYLASIVFNNGTEGYACSGTVVSSNVVLTAAHCVFNEAGNILHNPVYFRVSTGNVSRASPERLVSSVTRLAVYPSYSKTGLFARYGDAAVLGLGAPIAAPAVRLGGAEFWGTGSGALMVGWGLTSAMAEPGPAVLHYGTTTVQSPGFCASKVTPFHSEGQLCVSDAPSHVYSVCNGDSGGPLLVPAPGTGEPVEIGIASFVLSKECDTTKPQYYTRADLVGSWVQTKVAEWAPTPPVAPAPAPIAKAPAATAPAAPVLPRLTANNARAFASRALSQGLGYRFNQRRRLALSCVSVEAAKQRCTVSWESAASYYHGTVTVYYLFEGAKVVWSDRYRIGRVPLRCYRPCRPAVFQGT